VASSTSISGLAPQGMALLSEVRGMLDEVEKDVKAINRINKASAGDPTTDAAAADYQAQVESVMEGVGSAVGVVADSIDEKSDTGIKAVGSFTSIDERGVEAVNKGFAEE